ncbi:MAG TPA: hypothetical protein V6D15_12435 [Oculatellaceae cyanobacterium]
MTATKVACVALPPPLKRWWLPRFPSFFVAIAPVDDAEVRCAIAFLSCNYSLTHHTAVVIYHPY